MSYLLLIIVVGILAVIATLGTSTLIVLITQRSGINPTFLGMGLILFTVLIFMSGAGFIFVALLALINVKLKNTYPQKFVSFHYALGLIRN